MTVESDMELEEARIRLLLEGRLVWVTEVTKNISDEVRVLVLDGVIVSEVEGNSNNGVGVTVCDEVSE